MPLTQELNERLRDPNNSDTAMMEAAVYYIHQPGIHSEELIHLTDFLPFINTISEPLVREVLMRIHLANGLLPQIREFVGGCLRQTGIPGKDDEDALDQCRLLSVNSLQTTTIFVDLIHVLLGRVEELAATWNTPLRELQAAIARIGTETTVFLIGKSKNQAIKRHAKTNLVYFASIEMLSLGCITNVYQFSFVNPANVRTELLADAGQIMPIIDVSRENRLKGALAFGQVRVTDITSSGIPGIDFLHLD